MNSMNPWIKKALFAIVILAVAALLIFSFQKNFEYVEKTQWQPLSGEAKTNPLYASQLFLRRMGLPTETVESLQDLTTLPDTDTVILINSSRQTMREEQFNNLLDWVRNGGHLIISALADWGSFSSDNNDTPLVDESENSDNDEDGPVYYDESDEDLMEESSADPFQDFLNVTIREAIRFDDDKAEKITLKGSDRPLELGPDYYRGIVLNKKNKSSELEQVSINGKNVITRQRVDDGLISLVSDFGFIDNYNVEKFDHAEILWQIIRGKAAALGPSNASPPQAVWLIHSDETASLFKLIWKYFWALVITLMLLFLAWVLRVSRRFGPVIAKETEDRRNLLEHIDASGAYYWKQQNQDVLLESTRSAVQQQLAKRIPGWQAMSQPDQIQLLSNRLAINESQLQKSLYESISSNSAHEFTQTIKQLEHIRTSI